MTKADLIEGVAQITSTKKQAGEIVDTILDMISKSLKKDDPVALFGFGTFTVSKRKARKGRNPQTGEAIKIAAKKSVKFKMAKGLSTLMNGK